MFVSLEIPVKELLSQMLESNSIHSLFLYIAELEGHPCAEEWADKAEKLFYKTNPNLGED